MDISPKIISQAVQSHTVEKQIYVAYSGGVDSHVLLHLCAKIPELSQRLLAVHVHHGLQTSADSWAQHCQQTVTQLGIKFVLLRVNAQAKSGESPEEAARNARYQVLSDLLDDGDLLLTAQHREDQYETILLQMFRGAGLAGLSAMPAHCQLGQGQLLRPLLNCPKQAIDDYAHQQQLHWVEDDSNQSDDFDRNYLRNQISPLIKTRWPSADKTVARAGKHCAEAAQYLDQIAASAFLSLYNSVDCSLSIVELLKHDRYIQQLIIRQWFQAIQQRMPSARIVEQILDSMVVARNDAQPQVQLAELIIRRYRDRLYWHRQMPVIDHSVSHVWQAGQAEIKLPDNGALAMLVSKQSGIDLTVWQQAEIQVRYRQGGERIELAGRQGRHSLKKLFQEAGVPPWQRVNMPLIYINDELAAVADKWISNDFFREAGGNNIQLQWRL